ncbi:MAG TPA: AlkA N-terminal domain-containing protein [Propionibacteriaceae bacterium]|jgi:AraC family transcriptional regulator of adaptative response / DNA-3-methyladenine glycosylase II|nr:AlkA N-terminal domain-containing protein [Propionibacteriaceae bacterium]
MEQTFEVAATREFDAVALLSFLGKRTIAGVETYAVEPGRQRYARTVCLPSGPGMVELVWTGRTLLATTRTARADREEAAAVITRLCDADAPAPAIAAHLCRSEPLRRLVATRPGLRVPGTVDPAEMAFRTMIGQQISLAAAATAAAKLAAAYGEPVDLPDPALTRLFPTVNALAAINPEALPMPRSRGRALVGLARALVDGGVELTSERPWPVRREELLALPGIGPWTADYLAMRAYGDRDVLLDTDLVIKRELARRQIANTAEWSPYRSYATMHLWYSAVDFS